jgi:hypothetical protein
MQGIMAVAAVLSIDIIKKILHKMDGLAAGYEDISPQGTRL